MNLVSNPYAKQAQALATALAEQATQALLDEARLTPKPGLVDSRGSGAHTDLSLQLMERSAISLKDTFFALVLASWKRPLDVALRAEIGKIGRKGEQQMMLVTKGVNTHRGSIWTMGLLVSAMAMVDGIATAQQVTELAANLAQLPDHASPRTFSKGLCATRRYQVPGAREEAQQGFPHIMELALPELIASRRCGATEQQAQLNALLAIMSSLTDTCVLSRAGMAALIAMQQGAKTVLALGGVQTTSGWSALAALEQRMLADNVSPGGAADLFAATLFLDRTTLSQ